MGLGLSGIGIILKVALLHGKVMFHYQIWVILFSNKPVCFLFRSKVLSHGKTHPVEPNPLSFSLSLRVWLLVWTIWTQLFQLVHILRQSLEQLSWLVLFQHLKFIIAILNSLLYKQPLSIGEFNTSSTFCLIDLDLIADRHLGCLIVGPKSVYAQGAASATRHLTLTHHLGGGFTTTIKVMLTPAPAAPHREIVPVEGPNQC